MSFKKITLFSPFLLLFLLLGTLGLSLQAQTFKTYYHSKAFLDAPVFTVNQLIRVPGTKEIAFAGELKTPSPAFDAYGYVVHTDQDGGLLNMHAIKTNNPNGVNGIRNSGVAMDKFHRYYLAGASVPNLSQNSVMAERTLSSLAPDGKLNWSSMQGLYNFDAVVYNSAFDQLATISGPGDNLTPTDLVIQQFSTTGSFTNGVRITTPTADQPVSLTPLKGENGYIAVGMQDTAAQSKPFVVRLDGDLNIVWSHVFEVNGLEWNVQDMDVLPEGPIGVSGSVRSVLGGFWQPFLLTIDPDHGEPIFFQQYNIGGSQESRGFGLAAWFDPQEPSTNGWLLAGAWSSTAMQSNNRRSFVLKVNDVGKPAWTSTFSNFPLTDNDLDEFAKDIIYLPISQQFATVGEYSKYEHGILDRRMIFLVKAGIDQGNIGSDPFLCYSSLTTNMTTGIAAHSSLGTAGGVGQTYQFGYLEESLNLLWNYCAYIPEPKNKSKLVSSQTSSLKIDQQDNTIRLRLSSVHSEEATLINLFDVTGRRIRQMSLPAGQQEVIISKGGLTEGIYLLHIDQGKLNRGSQKIWIR